MIVSPSRLLRVLALVVLLPACSGDEEIDEVGVASLPLPAYHRTFKYQELDLHCDEEIKNDVKLSSRRHIYSFFGEAGARVRFELRFHEPESLGRGAELWIYDDHGALVGHALSWDSQTAVLEVTFPDTGEFFVYVSQADYWGMEYGAIYPYLLLPYCETGLCALVTLAPPDPAWEAAYFARNFSWQEEDAAWDWYPTDPDAGLTELDREVIRGQCRETFDDSCTADDPPVCCAGIDFIFTADNVCTCRNYVLGRAGSDGYDLGGMHPGVCP